MAGETQGLNLCPYTNLSSTNFIPRRFASKQKCEAEAVIKLLDGKGEMVDNSLEFIETADDRGMPVDQHPELVAALRKLDMCHTGDVIPSIRSIEKL